MIYRLSFRQKTIIGVGIIEAILLALIVWKSMAELRETNNTLLLHRVHSTKTLVATLMKDAVLSYDLASLDSYVQELLHQEGVTYVEVYDASMQVLSRSGPNLSSRFTADEHLHSTKDGVFDASQEMFVEGVKMGEIRLGFSVESMKLRLKKALEQIIAMATVEIFLSAFFSFVLGTLLTRKLSRLKEASEKISAGDLAVKVDVVGSDEIDRVGIAFNSMVLSLNESLEQQKQAQKQLEMSNIHLEERVKQRTQEIEDALARLQKAKADLELEKEEQAKLITELADTKSQLMHSEKMASVGQLAAGVAHEINNPIGFVKGNLAILGSQSEQIFSFMDSIKEKVEADAQGDLLEYFQKCWQEQDIDFIREDCASMIVETIDGAERVSRIVQDLKEYSHYGEDGWELVDLNVGLQSTLKIATVGMGPNIVIHKDFQSLPKIEASASRLNQVFMNLIINAIQAIGEAEGQIHVASTVEASEICISISDDGPGIPEELQSKIFDPFFTTKPVGVGTGLGLSNAYSIIEKHGGRLLLESREGFGTTFRIFLPLERVKSLNDK